MDNGKWLLEIEKVDNGYVLTGQFGDAETITKKIIEEKSNENLDELKSMQFLLWEIQEYFGIYNSKHNDYRLEIVVVDKEGKEIENE